MRRWTRRARDNEAGMLSPGQEGEHAGTGVTRGMRRARNSEGGAFAPEVEVEALRISSMCLLHSKV